MDIYTLSSRPNETRDKLTFDGYTQSTKDVINSLQQHRNVRELHFTDSFNWYIITKAIPKYNDLRKFEFNLCNVNVKAVKKLVARFPEIEAVKIVFGRHQFKFNYEIIRHLLKWKMLKEISIDTGHTKALRNWHKKNAGTRIIKLIATKCENLTSVEIENEVIYRGAFNKLIEGRGFALEKLNVEIFDLFNLTLSFRSNKAFKKCPNLRILHVNGEDGEVTVKKNTLLEELHVKDCCDELDNLFSNVVFNHLHTLTFNNCQFPLQFSVIKNSCPVLKCLELADLKIKDEENAAAFIAHSASNLERLTFESILNISSLSFLSLVQNLPKLVFLKYDKCPKTGNINIEDARKLNPDLEIIISNISIIC